MDRQRSMDAHRKTLILVNPGAGRGRARRTQTSVQDYLRSQGAAADFVETSSPAETEQRAREAAAAGYTHLVALGGDGTFHHMLNGAVTSDPASEIVLGLLPCGGGNDIARALGLPRDSLAAAHAFLTAPERAIDVLQVRSPAGTRLYMGAGGLGLDAEAARAANQQFRRLPGVMRYVAAALQTFRGFRPFTFDIEADGERTQETALLIAVANAPSYGSGLLVAPGASLEDGLMDLFLVRPIAWMRLLDGLLLALSTGDIRWPEVRRWQARRVKISADRPAWFHGDGEILGEAPVEIEVLPGKVRVAAR
jgi:diacylglycerol kinase (ATP)